jgi:hypothetical protein
MRCAIFILMATAATARAGSDPAETIRRQLTLTDRHQRIVQAVQDHTDTVDENPFYLMMDLIAELPSVPDDQLPQFDAPAWSNLLREPDRYRFRPVRLRMRVYTVYTMTTQNGKISRSPYWPDEKPIYAIYGTNADAPADRQNDQPIVVYSPDRPPDIGPPSDRNASGGDLYKAGPVYSLLGVFYKLIETGDDASGGTARRTYPVVLAWQMDRQLSEQTSTLADKILAGAIGLGVLGGVAVFILLKKRIRQTRRTPKEIIGDLHRRRNETDADTDEEDLTVDGDLIDTVNTWRKEKGLPPADNPSPPAAAEHDDDPNRSS